MLPYNFFSVYSVFLPVIHFFLSVFVPWGMDDVFITNNSISLLLIFRLQLNGLLMI